MTDYLAKFTGTMPLLMKSNDVDLQAEVKTWLEVNSAKGTAGDDRCPVWTWTAGLYHDKGFVSLPSLNLMAAIRVGASRLKDGKSNWSKPSQFALGITSDYLEFFAGGKKIPLAPILALKKRDFNLSHTEFEKHRADVEKLGFALHRVPVRNPATRARNIRVRPMFDEWSATCVIRILNPTMTEDILVKILALAGQFGGFGDWSPHAGKPGPYGTFTAELSAPPKKKSA
jgi:hypothetical protein